MLPKPTGRIKFTLNPCVMLEQLIGPRWCRRLGAAVCCFLCCLIFVLLLYYMVPVIVANIITSPITG